MADSAKGRTWVSSISSSRFSAAAATAGYIILRQLDEQFLGSLIFMTSQHSDRHQRGDGLEKAVALGQLHRDFRQACCRSLSGCRGRFQTNDRIAQRVLRHGKKSG